MMVLTVKIIASCYIFTCTRMHAQYRYKYNFVQWPVSSGLNFLFDIILDTTGNQTSQVAGQGYIFPIVIGLLHGNKSLSALISLYIILSHRCF